VLADEVDPTRGRADHCRLGTDPAAELVDDLQGDVHRATLAAGT
jgi:hypothetical protein